MKKYAIIAAGGAGVRMGTSVPKQFLEIKGKAILWYSIKAFKDAFEDINIIIVAPSSHIDQAKQICSEFNDVQFTKGGNTRFQSVKNGLAKVNDDSIVFVHDAVRCLVTKELIRACYEQALEKGSAIPSVAVNDSIRVMDGNAHKVIDRNNIRIIQTPQTFRSNIILPAFAVDDNDQFTDEATVVEASGASVKLIEGDQSNIKVTKPLDLIIAEKILDQRSSFQ